jgi:hypothetical protein
MKALGWAAGALTLVGLAAPAQAVDWRSIFGRDEGYSRYRYDPGRVAYEEGFRDGVDKGERDGKKGDRYSVRRHGDYRDADDGYRREYGPKYQYQRVYRRGFEAGYRRAYANFSYRNGRYGRDRDHGRHGERDRYGDYDRYEDDRYDERGRRY